MEEMAVWVNGESREGNARMAGNDEKRGRSIATDA